MGSLPGGRGAAPLVPPAFTDRAQAGAVLGAAVRDFLRARPAAPERAAAVSGPAAMAPGRREDGPVVLAIPRGGVPVAAGVARALGAPLDVLVVRKIGHPVTPELGLGAIAEDGAGGAAEPCFDEELLERVGLERDDLAGVVALERAELARRVAAYARKEPRPATAVGGRTAVVVDDGLATGVTARAALRAVRARGAARTVLAVPVASPGTVRALEKENGEVVTLVTPRRFRSVGEWYADFGQLADDDVLTLLAAVP